MTRAKRVGVGDPSPFAGYRAFAADGGGVDATLPIGPTRETGENASVGD